MTQRLASSTTTPLLSVEGIGVRFGGLAALNAVSFEVHTGDIVGLIGPNGAGKTTLFNVICGFVKPSAGSISFAGKSRTGTKPNRLAKIGIARTLQGVGLFAGMSVLDNVVSGAQSRTSADVISSMLALPHVGISQAKLEHEAMGHLERLGIAHVAGAYPGALPYGIQKKVSVARALMTRPKLLMLDEPASGLSETEVHDFADLIRDLKAEMSILLVEHNMDFVMPLCEQLVVLNFGEVIAKGTPAEVSKDPAVLAAYLGADDEGAA